MYHMTRDTPWWARGGLVGLRFRPLLAFLSKIPKLQDYAKSGLNWSHCSRFNTDGWPTDAIIELPIVISGI